MPPQPLMPPQPPSCRPYRSCRPSLSCRPSRPRALRCIPPPPHLPLQHSHPRLSPSTLTLALNSHPQLSPTRNPHPQLSPSTLTYPQPSPSTLTYPQPSPTTLTLNSHLQDLTAKQKKDQSAVERFQFFRDSHTYAWYADRHAMAQRFLDRYVRQNVAGDTQRASPHASYLHPLAPPSPRPSLSSPLPLIASPSPSL